MTTSRLYSRLHQLAAWVGKRDRDTTFVKPKEAAKLVALWDAAEEVLREWDKHAENDPATMNALRDALRKRS